MAGEEKNASQVLQLLSGTGGRGAKRRIIASEQPVQTRDQGNNKKYITVGVPIVGQCQLVGHYMLFPYTLLISTILLKCPIIGTPTVYKDRVPCSI
jgi:hypothetical protein